MSDLIAFLTAALDEDEAATLSMTCECQDDVGPGCPVRVLADVAAKRAIVERYRHAVESAQAHPCATNFAVRVALSGAAISIAQPYADRPGFDPAWRV